MRAILHATSGILLLLLIPILAIAISLAILYAVIKTAVTNGIMEAKKKIAEEKENQGGPK